MKHLILWLLMLPVMFSCTEEVVTPQASTSVSNNIIQGTWNGSEKVIKWYNASGLVVKEESEPLEVSQIIIDETKMVYIFNNDKPEQTYIYKIISNNKGRIFLSTYDNSKTLGNLEITELSPSKMTCYQEGPQQWSSYNQGALSYKVYYEFTKTDTNTGSE